MYSAEGDLNSSDNEVKSLILTSLTKVSLHEMTNIMAAITKSRILRIFLKDFIDKGYEIL